MRQATHNSWKLSALMSSSLTSPSSRCRRGPPLHGRAGGEPVSEASASRLPLRQERYRPAALRSGHTITSRQLTPGRGTLQAAPPGAGSRPHSAAGARRGRDRHTQGCRGAAESGAAATGCGAAATASAAAGTLGCDCAACRAQGCGCGAAGWASAGVGCGCEPSCSQRQGRQGAQRSAAAAAGRQVAGASLVQPTETKLLLSPGQRAGANVRAA